MSMTAVGAGDVVVDIERFADAHCAGRCAALKMRQAGHESARVEFIHLLFEQTNPYHLAIGAQPPVFLCFCRCLCFRLCVCLASNRTPDIRPGGCGVHFLPPVWTLIGVVTPDMAASTSNMQAKSYFAKPIPRAAVRISLLAAVVGSGTSS